MGMKAMAKFYRKLDRHRQGILNWYKSPLLTGPRTLIPKIIGMKRSAYRLRMPNTLTCKYMLCMSTGAHCCDEPFSLDLRKIDVNETFDRG
jgi:hypothetical protein